MTDPKQAFAEQKPPFSLMSYDMIKAVVMALDFGANSKGYGEFNWRFGGGNGVLLSTYVSAIQRHAAAMASGELIDPESGLFHDQHIAAGAAIVADARAYNRLIDDLSERNFNNDT